MLLEMQCKDTTKKTFFQAFSGGRITSQNKRKNDVTYGNIFHRKDAAFSGFFRTFVPIQKHIKHGKFLQVTGCFLWPHGAGPDLFPSYLRACCLAQVQGLHGGIPRAGSVAHPQPPNVPPARSGVHLPQSRRSDKKCLVLQNKAPLSRDKGALFPLKRQLLYTLY